MVDVSCLLATMQKSFADIIGAICTIFYMDNAKNCVETQYCVLSDKKKKLNLVSHWLTTDVQFVLTGEGSQSSLPTRLVL